MRNVPLHLQSSPIQSSGWSPRIERSLAMDFSLTGARFNSISMLECAFIWLKCKWGNMYVCIVANFQWPTMMNGMAWANRHIVMPAITNSGSAKWNANASMCECTNHTHRRTVWIESFALSMCRALTNQHIFWLRQYFRRFSVCHIPIHSLILFWCGPTCASNILQRGETIKNCDEFIQLFTLKPENTEMHLNEAHLPNHHFLSQEFKPSSFDEFGLMVWIVSQNYLKHFDD